ncbi:protein LBH [Astyanax mexicanus]|uniref:Protein LBH n=1 Tax=Astyanax mexicanus TaxID=7994 RepID=A0A8B9J4D3_ASTMX|nr:protein LBH [Astyanax mexicanus]KAG9274886.1 protein LBH [Astyanax mexicanus]
MSVYCPQVYCPAFVPRREMTEVMISATPMEDMRLSPGKESLAFQIFPDPSDFERCCKVKDRLPSIVVEPTDGEVESGELRWPPKEFIVSEEEEEDDDEDEEEEESNGKPMGQVQNSQH